MTAEHGHQADATSNGTESTRRFGPLASWSGAADPLSDRPSKAFRVLAWLNAIGNLVIIGTGGAVRLTGSGLGCPTWPLCSETSWIPTDELTGHALIEFGNRLMSPLLGLLALALLLLALPWRRRRSDLWTLSLVIFLGVIAQAIVGGITVLTKLNAWIVGFHYLASAALVGVGTALVLRARRGTEARASVLPRWLGVLTHIATFLLVVVLTIGVLTTANGPHSGDAGIVRDQDLWSNLAHLHAWAAYALVAVMLVLFAAAAAMRLSRFLLAVTLIIVLLAVQIVVGIIQANTGLPPLLVGIHMVLAGLSVAATVYLVDATKAAATQQRLAAE